MAFLDDIRSSVRRTGAPVTILIVSGLIGVSLVGWLFRGLEAPLIQALAFSPRWFAQPWTLLLYPFAYQGIGAGYALLFFLFLILWTYWIGSSVERDLGAARYAAFWAIITAVGGLSVWAGYGISGGAMGDQPILYGPSLPLAALLVAWATRNPEAIVMLFAILPLKAKWLAWGTVGLTVVGYGQVLPLVGIMCLVPIGLSYSFASNRIKGFAYTRSFVAAKPSKAQVKREAAFFDDVRKREMERQERERLRKLLENSINDEPDH